MMGAGVELGILFFPFMLVMAAAFDVMTLRIPNWLSLLTALGFVPAAVLSGLPFAEAALHLAVAFGFLSAGFLCFALRLLGAGDAKLMAAIGLWLGPGASPDFILYAVMAGGVLASVIAAYFILDAEANIRRSASASLFQSFKPNVPYGFALAAGAILALPGSWWMSGPAFAP